MDALFQDLMRILREARQAVQAEVEMQVQSPSHEIEDLRRLRRSAGEFGDQADSLASMMLDRDVEDSWITEAEKLCEFFRDAQERIAFLLAPGSR